jgi:protein involved in polysaccharide export with SLBB domain
MQFYEMQNFRIAYGGRVLMLHIKGVLCLMLVAVLAGCSAGNGPNDATGIAAASYAGPGPLRGSDGPYKLGPGDRVRIKVYDDVNLTDQYEVNSAGFVSIPLVGSVRASGLTTAQLERVIADRMKGKLAQDPKINVEIASYAPFYIYGEVKKAGMYPYQPGLTVADAIATAGGLTYRADERTVYLQRAGSPQQQAVRLDVPQRVFPGDNIRIAERMF